MIWAALAAAIAIAIAASQAGPDHWKELVATFRKAIHKNVKDKDHQQKALAILKAADADMQKTRKTLIGNFNYAYSIHLNYESTQEEFTAAVDAVMASVNAIEVAGMERRFELKEVLTPQEYNAVFATVQHEVIKDEKKEKKDEAKQEKKDTKKAAKDEKRIEKAD